MRHTLPLYRKPFRFIQVTTPQLDMRRINEGKGEDELVY